MKVDYANSLVTGNSSGYKYSPTGIGLINPDIIWLDVNESLAATLGYSPAELRDTKLVHSLRVGAIDQAGVEIIESAD